MCAIPSKIGDLKRDAFGLEFQEPLPIAVDRGFPALVQVLVEGGVDPNTRDVLGYEIRGSAGLHLAIESYSDTLEGFKSRRIVEVLVGMGAGIEARDTQERTPLYLVANRDALEIIEFLLKKGAKVDAKDGEGNTPFQTLLQNPFHSVQKAQQLLVCLTGARIQTRRMNLANQCSTSQYFATLRMKKT